MGRTRPRREATRERILRAAARLFRRDGYEGASIDDIMAAAGLTRGGFYLHFRSKQDLFAAAIGRELEFTRELRRARERSPDDPAGAGAKAIDYYLSPGNLGKIARGCTVVSNAADMARSRVPARRAFTRAFEDLVEEFESLVPTDAAGPRDRALAAIATCVGGVVLARALADDALVGELLGACRETTLGGIVGADADPDPSDSAPAIGRRGP